MKIAIDITPLEDRGVLNHKIRGTGFYLSNLKRSLLQYCSQHSYHFFTRGEKLPRNIDIVHYPYFDPFFITLPFFLHRNTIVTIHDLTPLVFPKNFPVGARGFLKWNIQKFLVKRSRAIITDSFNSKKDIIKYANISENKIQVVYLASGEIFKKITDITLLKEARNKYNLPKEFVLYVGDVTWNKNLPRLIQAIQLLDIPLVMVGKSLVQKDFDKTNLWNQDLIQAQKLAENNKKIIRLGFVSDQDLVCLYNLATLFVMPSLYEGFGLPVLEAMSCGCPVITTKEGSLSEIAGDSVYFIDPYDTKSIASGVRKVFFDEKLKEDLSSKGLRQSKKFAWKKTARETINVYEKVYRE